MRLDPNRHKPVLLTEVVETLQPQDGGRYIDGTFGAGGYSSAILQAANCELLGIDRDPSAVRDGQNMVAQFSPRLHLKQGRFSQMADLAQSLGWEGLDGVVLDIGVSSMQLDQAQRGFSFMRDGPLDMRMDNGKNSESKSAADVINHYDEVDLANIIYQLGEERLSRPIAKAIVETRVQKPFSTTLELAELVRQTIGRKYDKRHPATRTFQALRIYVNDELGELVKALINAEQLLKPGGRLVVVTFHSLEDRIVKRFFKIRSGRTANVSKYVPQQDNLNPITFRKVNQQGLKSSKQEVEENVRARSAKLRFGVRNDEQAPVFDPSLLGLDYVAQA